MSKSSKKAGKSPSKSEFVRAHPGISAPEVVRLAKEQGITLNDSLVYNVRSQQRKKVEKSGTTETPTPTSAAAAPAKQLAAKSPLEAQFRALVLRIGLDRSNELLEQLKTDIAA